MALTNEEIENELFAVFNKIAINETAMVDFFHLISYAFPPIAQDIETLDGVWVKNLARWRLDWPAVAKRLEEKRIAVQEETQHKHEVNKSLN